MKPIQILSAALIITGLTTCTKDPLASYPSELTTIKNSLESTFRELDNNLFASSVRLTAVMNDSARIRSELKTMFSNRPDYLLEYAQITPPGIMSVIEPPAYYSQEGSDISSQAHIIRVFNEKVPVLSETFQAVEGFLAVVEAMPVLKDGEAKGALTALFYPHQLMDPIIKPLIRDRDFEIWVMGKEGTLLWDQDLPDIGRNLYTDPYYDPFPNLRVAVDKIVAEDHGETTYSFFQAETTVEVVKRAQWVTFSHLGQEWKIVYVKIE
jgi:hypothetical protein